ncbi:MAG: hypothetical protein WBA07_24105 [Rivularia sp. (in: cyanobacteria)]
MLASRRASVNQFWILDFGFWILRKVEPVSLFGASLRLGTGVGVSVSGATCVGVIPQYEPSWRSPKLSCTGFWIVPINCTKGLEDFGLTILDLSARRLKPFVI